MSDHGADVVAYIECRRTSLPALVELAERVDKMSGQDPPEGGYGLAEAFSAILNGGTAENIQLALGMLLGWSFSPASGWPTERKEPV